MEWVEVTGVSVDAAKEAALDQLGVAEADAEIMVVSEPKSGLFGRVRGEARVRARVRPVGPRPKRNRRPARDAGRSGGNAGQGNRGGSRRPGRSPSEVGDRAPAAPDGAPQNGSSGERGNGRRRGGSGRGQAQKGGTARGGSKPDGRTRENHTGRAPERAEIQAEGMTEMAEGMTLEEQAEVASTFLEGLIEQYGLVATVETRIRDEETVELAVTGEGLGVLVGPKGATLAALQDLTRTAVQHRFPSRTDRILVDVARYRERRVEALQRFSRQVVSEVVETGEERMLEPMSPADRKVVHDTVNELDGVTTRSEGEEPRRFVVISPAG